MAFAREPAAEPAAKGAASAASVSAPPLASTSAQALPAESTFTVPEGVQGRADKILARNLPDHSRAGWQRAFTAGRVRARERVLDQNDSIRAGDVVTYSFPEAAPSDLTPNSIKLEVLFEDSSLVVINKPAGMIVHPGAGTGGDTMVHALLAHCAGKLSGIGGVERPGIVHRLDRETSGAIVVAKTDAAHRGLAAQFAERGVQKEYLALVGGVPPLLSGSIRKPIGRHPRHRHKMMAYEPGPSGGSFGPDVDAAAEAEEAGGPAAGPHSREAHTDWTVEQSFAPRASLLRCILHTGRTHQIRVHLKSIGHVILGDLVYGFKTAPGLPAVPRVMLHSERLQFTHPRTRKPIDVHAPLPADFKRVLKALGR